MLSECSYKGLQRADAVVDEGLDVQRAVKEAWLEREEIAVSV